MASEEMIPVRGDALKAFVVRVMRTQDVTAGGCSGGGRRVGGFRFARH